MCAPARYRKTAGAGYAAAVSHPAFSLGPRTMPSIPKELSYAVVYLYPDAASAQAGVAAGGTGFLVAVPSQVRAGKGYVYAVTNWHVALRGGASVIRVNTRAGGTDVLELDPSEWIFEPGSGDVAVAGFKRGEIDQVRQGWDCIGIDELMTAEEAQFSPGDDVFMIGRFVNHDGVTTNRPAIRCGSISVDPTPVPGMSNGAGVSYYCLDMHSRTGFSGSPVFAYRTPGSDLADAYTRKVNLKPAVMRLLGIHCGQFSEELVISEKGVERGRVAGYSGMTIALPAWHIGAIINGPHFATLRAQGEAELAAGL